MRLAILSDIHGNLPALEAVLADAARQGVDGYVVAGDMAYGPQMAEAMQRLHGLGAWMVRGRTIPGGTSGNSPACAGSTLTCRRTFATCSPRCPSSG